jgi:uncharacterized protein YjbI with pentapeptide repeats
MKNSIFITILIILSIFWYGFQIGKVNTPEELQNITDFTGANLTQVNLDNAILCNTTMPDGRINNCDCKN